MKKFIKSIIASAVTFTMLSASAFAAFSDMPSGKEGEALQNAVNNGLLNGVSETEIAPYMSITRAQMAAILSRAMGATQKIDLRRFADVDKSAWYYNDVAKAVYMGAFEGGVSGTDYYIYPEKVITYQEAFVVLSRVFDLKVIDETAIDNCSDKAEVADWAKDSVLKVVSGGYYVPDGKIHANEPLSRVTFAVIMDNLIKNYIDTPGTVTELKSGNTLIRSNGVILDSVKSQDTIYIGDGVSKTEFKNVDLDMVIVRGGEAVLSGTFGYVIAICGGVVLSPVDGEVQVKTYPDGTKGVIWAAAEGSYINMGKVIEQN